MTTETVFRPSYYLVSGDQIPPSEQAQEINEVLEDIAYGIARNRGVELRVPPRVDPGTGEQNRIRLVEVGTQSVDDAAGVVPETVAAQVGSTIVATCMSARGLQVNYLEQKGKPFDPSEVDVFMHYIPHKA